MYSANGENYAQIHLKHLWELGEDLEELFPSHEGGYFCMTKVLLPYLVKMAASYSYVVVNCYLVACHKQRDSGSHKKALPKDKSL
jgi:hypothetical protein